VGTETHASTLRHILLSRTHVAKSDPPGRHTRFHSFVVIISLRKPRSISTCTSGSSSPNSASALSAVADSVTLGGGGGWRPSLPETCSVYSALHHDFSTAISTAYTSHDRPRRTHLDARSHAQPYAQEARWARGTASIKATHAATVGSASPKARRRQCDQCRRVARWRATKENPGPTLPSLSEQTHLKSPPSEIVTSLEPSGMSTC
jgi:hypothetical protein